MHGLETIKKLNEKAAQLDRIMKTGSKQSTETIPARWDEVKQLIDEITVETESK